MSNPKTNKLVPDYDSECCNCSQGPTVCVADFSGKIVIEYDMCGPCTLGEADAIDPDNWN